MADDVAERWQKAFVKTVTEYGQAKTLRDSAIHEQLGEWTRALTAASVATCAALDWQASAKGHPCQVLPVKRHEYLSLDLVAFAEGEAQWPFPVAVMEFENNKTDHFIAYALWKVLCVRTRLRVVFCYRAQPDQASSLVRFLRDEVIYSMPLEHRTTLEGQTVVVVGSRDESATFPYGFFKWWRFDRNVGSLSQM